MKAKKSVVAVVGAFLLTVIALLGFAGCRQEDPKYDVAIKVVNNYGMEWVFEPGVDELYYEFEYTGEEMTFGIDDYYVYGDPHGGDRWLDYSAGALGRFSASWGYINSEGKNENVNSVLERGNYSYAIYTNYSSWNYRSVRLYITVK